MSDLSLVEFIVYGFICYSSILMLIISIIKKDIPSGNPLSTIRVIFIIPGMFAAAVLSSSGVDITTETVNTSNIIKDLNNTDTWSETTTQLNKFVLINPVWITFHFLLFIIMFVYVFTQVFMLFDDIRRKNKGKGNMAE